jgi:hypothetical protein
LRAEAEARRDELEEMFGAPAVERLLAGKRLPFVAAIMLAARKPSKEAQAARVRMQEASGVEEVSRARSSSSFDDYMRRMQQRDDRLREARASRMRGGRGRVPGLQAPGGLGER